MINDRLIKNYSWCPSRLSTYKWNSLCSDPESFVGGAVILLPAHPAFFTHTFVSGMQSFYFSETQDAKVLQTCHEKKGSGILSLQLDSLI